MTDPTTSSTAETASTSSGLEVQILTAKEVSVPIMPTAPQDVSPQLLRIRSDFLAGKNLSSDDLGELIRSTESGGGGNGNCNIC